MREDLVEELVVVDYWEAAVKAEAVKALVGEDLDADLLVDY